MKDKIEIEQLANDYGKSFGNTDGTTAFDFKLGYLQCQEDMIEILKEEIRRAYIHGQGNGQMMEAGLERDEVDDYTNSRMLSLNKQDI